MLAYFPEYRGMMNSYFQQENTSFDTYLVEHEKNPLVMLWWARLFQVLLNVFLFLAAFFLLRSMLDEWTALAILLLTSFTPYLFGQSRMRTVFVLFPRENDHPQSIVYRRAWHGVHV